MSRIYHPTPMYKYGPMQKAGGAGAIGNPELFNAPITTSLTPSIGTLQSFARASAETVPDWEGIDRTARVGEARFHSARRVENLMAQGTHDSENINDGKWLVNTGTTIDNATQFTVPDGANDYIQQANGAMVDVPVTNDKWVIRLLTAVSTSNDDEKLQGRFSATGTADRTTAQQIIRRNGGEENVYGLESSAVADDLATGGVRVRFNGINSSAASCQYTATNISIENVKTQATTYPSEYLDSTAQYGAGVIGVKYFDVKNPNYWSGNEATGTDGTLYCAENTFLFGAMFGDSITAGTGGTDLQEKLNPKMRGFIQTLNGNGGYPLAIANEGTPGQSVEQVYNDNIASTFGNFVILQGIANDIKGTTTEEVSITRLNNATTALDGMITDALSRGKEVLLVGMHPWELDSNNGTYSTARTLDFNTWCSNKAASTTGVYYADTYAALEDTPSSNELVTSYALAADDTQSVHLSDAGYEAWATAIYAAVPTFLDSSPAFIPYDTTALSSLRGCMFDASDVLTYDVPAKLLDSAVNNIGISLTFAPIGTPSWGARNVLFYLAGSGGDYISIEATGGTSVTFNKKVGASTYTATRTMTLSADTEYAVVATLDDSGVGISVDDVSGTGDADTSDVDLSGASFIAIGSDGTTNFALCTIRNITVY